jgi:hypothetical protein
MVHLTPEQLRAMFSKQEIRHGISQRDISNKIRFLESRGVIIDRPKRIIQPRAELKQSNLIVTSTPEKTKVRVTDEERDVMLPTRFKVIQSGERKGETVRKKKFGEIPRPEDEASERQKLAVQRFSQQDVPTARNLSINQLISSEKIKQMQFKQLTDPQKVQLQVLRTVNPALHRQILAQMRANEIPSEPAGLTRSQANQILRKRDIQNSQQIISALQGEKVDDPSALATVNQLTPGQRNAAVEALFSFASAKGKASPRELAPGQIRRILQSVKVGFTREGIQKIPF